MSLFKSIRTYSIKFLLLFICIIFSKQAFGLSSGNPADPILLSRTTWGNDSTYNLLISSSCARSIADFKISSRFGFSGNYIYSESAGVKEVPIILIANGPTLYKELQVNNMTIASSGATGTITIQDTSNCFTPIWDIDLYGTIGGLSAYYRLPMAAFRIPTALSAPTDGVIEVQTNYGFMWHLGAKKVFWKDGNSFLSGGVDYKHASCPLNYVILHQAAEPELFIEHEDDTSNNSIGYKEWSINVGIATRVTNNLVPYVSLATGNTYFKAGSPEKLFTQLTTAFPDLKFLMRKIKNTHHLNVNAGLSYVIQDSASLNLEGTWGYQRAVSCHFKIQL
ncbi:MAG: hypothetical protein RSB82_00145 [Victivallaceae bacterium]